MRIHYKKTWQFEGKALTDRSTVGLYFAQRRHAQELLSLPIDSPAPPRAAPIRRIRFSRTLAEDVQALALSPDKVPGNISLQVEAIKPDGSRVPMIRLNTRADWDRRYWFEKPMTLPRGTRVEVTANLQDPDMLSAAFTSTPGAAAAPARRLGDAPHTERHPRAIQTHGAVDIGHGRRDMSVLARLEQLAARRRDQRRAA